MVFSNGRIRSLEDIGFLNMTKSKTINEGKTLVTPEWRPYSVPTAFKKLQNAEVRAVQTPATLCKRCGSAVQSPRTPCGGVYFEHAQNKRRGLAFPHRVRQHAVATLWGLLERRGRVMSAPRVRCKDAV